MLFNMCFWKQILMDNLSVFQYEPIEIILILGSVLLICILIAETYEWSLSITKNLRNDYGYDDENGPAIWKRKYSEANGSKQSPINISSRYACCMPSLPLVWSRHYAELPKTTKITNDGHTVVMTFDWECSKPRISGGCLDDCYELCAIRFRWGEMDMEGSEHAIDYSRYALELQAVHSIAGYNCPKNNEINGTVIMISYIYQVTRLDNPLLEPLISNLHKIRMPMSSCMLPKFPVSWLMPLFLSDFYMYEGSLTFPPCSEGIKWILQPEPLAISAKQVRKFRKLLSSTGPLLTNCRPLQNVNGRDVFYYSPYDKAN